MPNSQTKQICASNTTTAENIYIYIFFKSWAVQSSLELIQKHRSCVVKFKGETKAGVMEKEIQKTNIYPFQYHILQYFDRCTMNWLGFLTSSFSYCSKVHLQCIRIFSWYRATCYRCYPQSKSNFFKDLPPLMPVH